MRLPSLLATYGATALLAGVGGRSCACDLALVPLAAEGVSDAATSLSLARGDSAEGQAFRA